MLINKTIIHKTRQHSFTIRFTISKQGFSFAILPELNISINMNGLYWIKFNLFIIQIQFTKYL
jgi:hypothetical protein